MPRPFQRSLRIVLLAAPITLLADGGGTNDAETLRIDDEAAFEGTLTGDLVGGRRATFSFNQQTS